MKIYTKAGDQGRTSLGTGVSVPKNHGLVEAYGTIDELSSFVGLAISGLQADDVAQDLLWAQRKLFVVASMLAGIPGEVTNEDMAHLEEAIDRLTAELPPLRDFILPGGTMQGAQLHVARTVCRRAERLVVTLLQDGVAEAETILPFLNRLSDYLFCAARFVNHRDGNGDPLVKLDK
jgi:cob(I)alamin adenosyltransferase